MSKNEIIKFNNIQKSQTLTNQSNFINNKKIFNKKGKTIQKNKKSAELSSRSKTNEVNIFELNSSSYDKTNNEKVTSKIDYRHCKIYPIKDILPMQKLDNDFDEYYWLVTYDKLIKTKKILKILNSKFDFYDKNMYTEKSLKIKNIKIPNFEIFFVKGFDKPFVRPNKDSFILTKIYLLSMEEINTVINYLNRTEGKIDIKKYVKKLSINNNSFCDIIKKNNRHNKDIDISYPYCHLFHIGRFMNISMVLFTNTFNKINKSSNSQELNNKKIIYSLPSSKKLHKLVKLLINTFPDYTPDYLIDYLLKPNLYINCDSKKKEILKLLSLLKYSVPNKFLLNKVLRDTIAGIQTASSKSGSSILIESVERYENPIKNQNKISVFNKNISLGIKNSLKSNNIKLNNGQLATTNYLSTNHTLMPSNSINTFNNSLKINPLTITIPCEINNAKKEKTNLRVGTSLTSTNLDNNKRISNYFLTKKDNNVKKKLTSKDLGNVLKIKNSDDKENIHNKENIDINRLLINRKKDEGNSINKIFNCNDTSIKCKKNEKKSKISNNSKIYHTPKKRKKYKYYK